jgi:uncharacterized iron-regulated membrane protein
MAKSRSVVWPQKKQWLDWHSLLGITTGLMMFIICWSGTFATISLELDWLLNSDIRSNATQVDNTDLLAAYQAVQQTSPAAQIIRIDELASANYSLSVLYKSEQGALTHAFFDPHSQRLSGTTSFLTVSRFFRDFHMSLFGFYGIGKYLVCIFAVSLMASLISILFFYKPTLKRFFEFPATSSIRAFWGSLHRLLGLWSIWFLLVIGITGVWYLFEQTRNDILDGRFSYTDTFSNAVYQLPEPAAGMALSLQQLTLAAQNAMPELDIKEITLSRGGYVYFAGQTDSSLLVRNRANKIYIEPSTGNATYVQRATDLPAYWYWSNMADPLHFGNFGGWITKTLWVIFGLLLSFLSLSGSWMYIKRLAGRPQRINRKLLKNTIVVSLLIGGLTLVMGALRINAMLPVVNGQRIIEIPMPVATFLLLWTLITGIICLVWGRWLLRASLPTN